jgi:PAS domain S-box-containing protein
MSDKEKTKGQLIEELQRLRQRVAELQESENQRKRTEAEIVQLNRELTTLNRVSQVLTSTLDLQETLAIITDHVTWLLGVEAASVILHDEAKGDLWFAAASGEGADFMQSARLALGQGIAGWVVQHGEPVIVPDVSEDTRWFGDFDQESGLTTGSILCVPLQTKGQTIGAIEVMNKESGSFDQEDLRLLTSMAAPAATAIETARLYDQSQKEITERRRVEEALQESERRLKTILDSLQIGVVIVDAKTHAIVDANPVAIGMISAPKEKIVGHTCHKFVCPAEVGKCPITDLGQAVDKAERILINANGEIIPILKTVTPTILSGREHLVESFIDITERKAVEEALRVSEERFALAVQGSNDGLWDWDIQNNSLYWSPRLKEMLGYADDELDIDFDTFDSLLHPDDRELIGAAIDAHLKDQVPYDVEERLRAKSGEYHWFRARGQAIWDETGQPLRMTGSTTDITERKQAEAERERLLTALEYRGAQLQTAARVSGAASSILDPDELIQQVVDLVRERFDLYYAGLFLMDEERQFAVLHAGTGEAGRKMLEAGHKLEVGGESMIGWCVANKQARIALDVGEEAVRFDNPLLPETRSEMALPLISRGQVIGAMTIQSTQSAAFSKEDITVLQTMADQLASAIENAHLFEDTKSRLAQLTALQETTKAVASTLELDRLIHLITQQATTLLQGDGGIMNLVDWEKKEDEVVAANGSCAHTLGFRDPLEDSLSGWVTLHNQPVISNQLPNDNRVGTHVRSGEMQNQSAAIAPLTIKDQVIGTLVVMDKQEGKGEFNQADLDFLIAFANQAATAIENARLFEETRRRAEEQQGLARIAALAASTLELDELLEHVMEETARMLDSQTGVLLLLDEARGELVTRYILSPHVTEEIKRAWRIPLDTPGFENSIFARGGSYFCNDVEGDLAIIPTYRPHIRALKVHNFAGVALQLKGRSIGELYIGERSTGFGAEDTRLLRTIAGYVASAIENARLFEETQQTSFLMGLRVKELACLNEIGREIEETPSISEFLKWLAGRIPPATQYPDLCLAAIEFEGRVYGAAEAVSLPCQIVQALRIGGGVVGRIYIAYIEEHDFLDEESALLGEIARRVSGYIESRHLFEQTQARAEELAVLNEMSRTLTAILDVDAMIESIYHYTSRLMDTTNFYVALYEAQQDAVSFPLYAEGERIRRVGPRRAGKGLTEYVIRTGEPLLIKENVSAWLEELGCDLIGQEAQSWLGVPMTIGERVIGVVAVQSYTTPQLYDEHDRDLLSAIASQVAIAIENARLFEQAQARAERERLVRTITDRVRQGTDREAIMRTTLQELGQMLGASKSIVRLGTQEQLLSEH